MGCRDFEQGTPNSISSSATAYASTGTAHTIAALVVVESNPGSAMVIGGVGDSAGATSILLATNSGSNDWAGNVGGNAVSSGITTLNGVPELVVWTKATGTVATNYYRYRYDTLAWSTATSASVANRTAGAATFQIGVLSGIGGFEFDGQIGAIALYNRALSQAEAQSLNSGRASWLAQFGKGGPTTVREAFIDLTQPGTIRDQLNPSVAYTAGTQPAFGPDAIRFPGW